MRTAHGTELTLSATTPWVDVEITDRQMVGGRGVFSLTPAEARRLVAELMLRAEIAESYISHSNS